jgi:hypothetical protein
MDNKNHYFYLYVEAGPDRRKRYLKGMNLTTDYHFEYSL